MSQRYIGGLIYNPPGGYSGYFDGSGDYLNAATNTAFNFGTGDATVEFWFNAAGAQPGNYPGIVSSSDYNTSGSASIRYSNTGYSQKIFMYLNGGGDPVIASASTIAYGVWAHVAIVRQGTSLKLYLNGTQDASVTISAGLGFNLGYGELRVGRSFDVDGAGGYFNGSISNLRLVKGTAVYTSAFTPPNGPLQAISGTSLLTCAYSTFRDGSSNNFTITVNGNTSVSTQNPFPITTLPNPALGNQGNGVYSMSQYVALKAQGLWPAYDPYFDQTTLLLHGDGTNGAQNNTFLDSSTNNFTITRNGNTTQGTFSPFSQDDGKWGAYFDGSGDYLSVAHNTALNLSSGDFTIEFWAFVPNSVSNCVFVNKDGVYGSTQPQYDVQMISNRPYFRIGSANGAAVYSLVYPSESFPKDQWTHIAAVKASSTMYLFMNGVLLGTAAAATMVDVGNPLYIGWESGSSTYGNGYISNVRIVKGSAVYTSAFTPSTTPLTAITNTSLLTCQSNRFKDNSANNFAITVNGNTSIQPFSPFAPSAAYSAAVNGGSGYFDGSGDSLAIPYNSVFNYSSSIPFTVELWFYPTVSGTDNAQWAASQNGGVDSNLNWLIRQTSSNKIRFVMIQSGGTVVANDSTDSFQLNAWNHFAAVMTGSATKTWLNGVYQQSVAFNGSQQVNGNISLGAWTTHATGYMASFRYVVNSQVYTGTSNITVPTAPLTAISNTQLLTNFINAGILDNTGRNDLETVGNAQISTSVKKFGTGSLAFDGTGDYLLLRPSQQLIFEGDFTIEFWSYITLASSTYHSPIGNYYGNVTTSWQIEVQNTGVIRLYYNGSSSPIVSASGVITNETWQHIAAVRSGSTVALYVNGSQIGTASFSGALGNTTTNTLIASIPQTTTQELVGYIDDLRITKGIARYTGNFTPQTSQWQDQ